MDKILLVAYGNISNRIPLFNYIIKNFVNIYNKPSLIHTSISNNNDFSDIIKTIPLYIFKDNNSFYTQSSFIKIKRYIKLILLLIRFLRNKELKTLYTSEIEVVILLRYINYFINFKNSTILIYHQFEMIELDNYGSIKKYLINLSLKYFKHFNLIIIPEINRINYFITQTGVDRNSILLFPNTCSSNISINNNAKVELKEISENNLIIGHIGNVNTVNFYLKELLESFNILKLNNIKLLFVGNLTNSTREVINRYSNDNIIIKGFIPHKELESIYNLIDIGLILYKPHKLNEEYCAPNKLYEYLSYGIPIIAPKLAGLDAIFKNNFLGYLIDFNDSAKLQISIENIASNLNNRKQEIIHLFKNQYDIHIYIKKLNQILERLEIEKAK